MALSIGIDVGGTKITAGVVDDEGKVLQTIRRDSPAADRQVIINTITMVMRRLREDFPDVATVDIRAVGFISSDRNTIAHGTSLDWAGMRIGDVVSKGVDLPVVVENDTNAFGWAEARFRTARGKRNALIVAISTSVGGAIIVDGHLLRGTAGFGGEIGHLNVVPDGRPCGCGLRGCLERYGAGTVLGVSAWELAQSHPDYAARIIELSSGNPRHISGKAITATVRERDPAALECCEQLTHQLGVGLTGMCVLLDFEVIVIADGLAEAGDILLAPTRKAFIENLTTGTHRPVIPVILVEGGQEAGLVSAADLARRP